MDESELETRTIRHIYVRLVPFLFALLIVNYLDRVNVGFAALRMNADLGLSASAFGFGAGIFFVGYALAGVPSNMVLQRVGARLWIGRIMVVWGIISGAMAFVHNETSFFILRFLLGVAEGGFLPAIVVYLTDWFPESHRSKANSSVVVATALASAIGSPLSGLLLTYFGGVWGLKGWQWMFLLEAAPAVALGLVVMVWLTDAPRTATWLAAEERAWLINRLEYERSALSGTANLTFAQVVRLPRIWALSVLFTCFLTALYGMLLWLPQIVNELGALSNLQVGLLSSVPFSCAAVAMILVGRHSDRHGERKWHLAASMAAGGVGLLGSAYAPTPASAFVLLCVSAAGIWGALGVFWTLAGNFLAGNAKAIGIAVVNTLAQIGGLAGPWVLGIVKQRTGDFSLALTALAAFAFVAVLIAALMPDRRPASTLILQPKLPA